jgi:hypothetical protein
MSAPSEELTVITDHYLIVAKLRERLSVSKRARQNFDLKKLNDVEVKGKY